MLTPELTTFHRIQTDDPAHAVVFFSMDLVTPMNTTISGPIEPVQVELTGDELAVFQALVTRARLQFVAAKNQAAGVGG